MAGRPPATARGGDSRAPPPARARTDRDLHIALLSPDPSVADRRRDRGPGAPGSAAPARALRRSRRCTPSARARDPASRRGLRRTAAGRLAFGGEREPRGRGAGRESRLVVAPEGAG